MQNISTIQFGILGDDDIKDLSVTLINNPSLKEIQGTVYDSCLGCVNVRSICSTCSQNIWKCPGHFGHIVLNCEIILFWKEAVKFLKCFCNKCGRLICNISGKLDYLLEIFEKTFECIYCAAKTDEYKLIHTSEIYIQRKSRKGKNISRMTVAEIRNIFSRISPDDLKQISIDPNRMHPKNLVLSVFPVIPICCRPKVVVGTISYDDDLSISLSQIIKLNWKVKQASTEKSRQAVIMQLQLKILFYCNNSKGKDVHSSNNKVMLGIRERISKKTGLIRQNIMGKRSDFTARSVVGPYPTLELDEVTIPEIIANTLTIPEYVTPHNLKALNRFVEIGDVPFITRSNGIKISTVRLKQSGSTILKHGDLLNGERVYDCNMAVKPGSMVTREGETFEYVFKTNRVNLQIGDIAHRVLQDGDPIVLNRQPTLHKNSMMGMRVKRWPGKTICVNLAITAGFNMDFDGDEGNLNLPQTPEAIAEVKLLMNAKHHVLSNQINRAAVVIVQDSLLGAYLMTRYDFPMTRDEFFDCLLQVNHEYPISRAEKYSSRQLWNFLFPPTFHYHQKELIISFGKLIAGTITKSHLKSGANSLIRVLFLDYGPEIVNNFVTNVQRMVTMFLTQFPHSISIEDCIIPQKATQQIKQNIDKYIEQANCADMIPVPTIREKHISEALNSAKDLGNKIAKDCIDLSTNKLAAMVESGSKGDYFNLSQIMGLLGQQNITGSRIKKDIDHKFRTLPYYQRVIFDNTKYESRGFVRSSFIQGLNPKELFFHTKAGREGIIDTSHRTGSTGYMERKMIKIAEDLIVHYDGTVRDGRKNIIQLLYGNYGFDPVVTIENGIPIPVDVDRLANHIDPFAQHPLSLKFIDELVKSLTIGTAFTPPVIHKVYGINLQNEMRKRLLKIKLDESHYSEFKTQFLKKFYAQFVSPGEAVGILAAQSIGEQQTQQMLNTFHTTGKFRQETNRISEILNMSKTTKNNYMKIFFKSALTPNEIRYIMRKIIYVTPNKLVQNVNREESMIHLTLDLNKVYKYRVMSAEIAQTLNGVAIDELHIKFPFVSQWEDTYISGIKGISDYFLQYENNEWFVITEGSNVAEIIALDVVDGHRLYSNNLWEIYNIFGICAVRKQILTEFIQHCDTCAPHLTLMTDLMTFYGKPMAADRYTMRRSTIGPLSKATFEESMDILTSAAVYTETETMCGVSAVIMVGNRIRMGTGFFDLKYKLILE